MCKIVWTESWYNKVNSITHHISFLRLPSELDTLEGQQQRKHRLTPTHQWEVPLAPAHEKPLDAASEVSVEGKGLTDRHIDHAQHLLGSRFLHVSGFQSTIVFQNPKCVHVKCPISSFVQILHVHNNHWLTVSNLHCDNDTVKVYDSLNSTMEVSEKFGCQLAALLNCRTQIKVQVVKVQQQVGYLHCGLFAVAFATSLCFDIPPETQNFIQKEMRSHLASCFQNGVLNPFPVFPSISTPMSCKYHVVDLCLKCRRPKGEKNNLIICMLCNMYHSTCVEFPADIFVCLSCQQEIPYL